eukprot:1047108_1
MRTIWCPSEWNAQLDGFCESNLNTEFEYGNIFSSLCILLFGVYGLKQLPSSIHKHTFIWHLAYDLLICIGIGSTMFHYQLTVFWGLLDSLPMLLIAFILLYYGFALIFRLKIDSHACVDSNTKWFHFISKSLGLLIIFYYLDIMLTDQYFWLHAPQSFGECLRNYAMIFISSNIFHYIRAGILPLDIPCIRLFNPVFIWTIMMMLK